MGAALPPDFLPEGLAPGAAAGAPSPLLPDVSPVLPQGEPLEYPWPPKPPRGPGPWATTSPDGACATAALPQARKHASDRAVVVFKFKPRYPQMVVDLARPGETWFTGSIPSFWFDALFSQKVGATLREMRWNFRSRTGASRRLDLRPDIPPATPAPATGRRGRGYPEFTPRSCSGHGEFRFAAPFIHETARRMNRDTGYSWPATGGETHRPPGRRRPGRGRSAVRIRPPRSGCSRRPPARSFLAHHPCRSGLASREMSGANFPPIAAGIRQGPMQSPQRFKVTNSRTVAANRHFFNDFATNFPFWPPMIRAKTLVSSGIGPWFFHAWNGVLTGTISPFPRHASRPAW